MFYIHASKKNTEWYRLRYFSTALQSELSLNLLEKSNLVF